MSLPPEAAKYLDAWLGGGWSAEPLAGDASVRAYYRISAGPGTFMLAYYPEEVRSQLRQFLSAYEAVAGHGRVPEVLQHSDVAVLQHDVGDRTLFDVLQEDRPEGIRLYRAAIELLVAFQQTPDPGLNPPFAADFFFRELEMAREYFVGALLGRSSETFLPLMRMLCENVTRHPYVLCHRDFHGQNIHAFADTIYLIDYQDLRMGPDAYDMASLLRDRGVGRILGEETESELLEYYRELTGGDAAIRRRYFETLLQRSIKILGTFAKQPIVRGRLHYIDFIPPTLESIGRCLQELPDYAPLRDIFPPDLDLARARQRARELNDGAAGFSPPKSGPAG